LKSVYDWLYRYPFNRKIWPVGMILPYLRWPWNDNEDKYSCRKLWLYYNYGNYICIQFVVGKAFVYLSLFVTGLTRLHTQIRIQFFVWINIAIKSCIQKWQCASNIGSFYIINQQSVNVTRQRNLKYYKIKLLIVIKKYY